MELIANADEFGRLIDRWMADRSAYAGLRENFLKLRYEENPTVVVQELIDLAQEVSGTALKPAPFPPPRPRRVETHPPFGG